MRQSEFGNAFADVWSALPKVVFSHTLDAVKGNARLATAPLGEEIASALAATDQDVSIGGADLLGQALEHGLLGEVRMFRGPVVLGGGTPYLPTVSRALHLELVETRRFDQVVYERYRLGGEIGATPAGSDT